MSEIKNRYEFVYLFDVENGNPNGDPDAGNMPRIDPETNHGIVTDVCLKRKIRNYVQLKHAEKSPHRIYIKEKAILMNFHDEAHEAIGAEKSEDEKKRKGTGDEVELAKQWMCDNFYDVRTFGAVMALKTNCGVVTGPVQLNFARSMEPVVPLEITITRMAVATQAEADKMQGDNRTMGRKHIVPYGLYRAEGYISANLAQKTGFSEDDLSLLWDSLINMFDHDHSAARGKMNARKLIVFMHDSEIGNAPAHKLFEMVKIYRVGEGGELLDPDDVEESKKIDKLPPARKFTDYKVLINDKEVEPMKDYAKILEGVEMQVRI